MAQVKVFNFMWISFTILMICLHWSMAAQGPVDAITITRVVDSSEPYNKGHEPETTIDGNNGTNWNPNIPEGQYHNNWYITFELSERPTVVGASLLNYGDGVHDVITFTLEASDDQVTWHMRSNISDVKPNSNDWQSFYGFNVTGKYLRFTVTETLSGYQPWLKEIRFTGYSEWTSVTNGCIYGPGDLDLSGIASLDDCKARCLAETSFVCKSAEYNFEWKRCKLDPETSKSSEYKHPCPVEGWFITELIVPECQEGISWTERGDGGTFFCGCSNGNIHCEYECVNGSTKMTSEEGCYSECIDGTWSPPLCGLFPATTCAGGWLVGDVWDEGIGECRHECMVGGNILTCSNDIIKCIDDSKWMETNGNDSLRCLCHDKTKYCMDFEPIGYIKKGNCKTGCLEFKPTKPLGCEEGETWYTLGRNSYCKLFCNDGQFLFGPCFSGHTVLSARDLAPIIPAHLNDCKVRQGGKLHYADYNRKCKKCEDCNEPCHIFNARTCNCRRRPFCKN